MNAGNLKKLFLSSQRKRKDQKVYIPKLPRLQYPRALERELEKLFISVLRLYKQSVIKQVLPNFVRLPIRQDSWVDDARLMIQLPGEEFERLLKILENDTLLKLYAVSNYNYRQLQKIVSKVKGKNLAIEFTSDKFTQMIQTYSRQAVELIRNIKEGTRTRIEKIVVDGVLSGKTNKEIEKLILGSGLTPGVFSKVEARAKLIARDITGKIYANVTKERQTKLGVTRYVWRTSLDQRVRPEHRAREGKIFYWDKPPEGGPPGEDYNCRCTAEPILEDLFV